LALRRILSQRLWRTPAAATHLAGSGPDLVRGRHELIVENMLLRHQLIVLRRSVPRPTITAADRAILVLLAGRLRAWRQVLVIVQPATLLRWHLELGRHEPPIGGNAGPGQNARQVLLCEDQGREFSPTMYADLVEYRFQMLLHGQR
jgi:hypothetical protein